MGGVGGTLGPMALGESAMSLLQVRNVHKSFGAVQAVRGVSLELHAGELLAVIGPNGAGKSTLFNLVNGQLHADQGEVRLQGESLAGLSAPDIWRRGVARTFQIAQVFPSLTVRENVQTVLLSKARRSFGLWRRANAFAPAQAQTVLQQVGLGALAQQSAGALAYGDVKRLELALALAGVPRVLLMDEPTAGMAPEQRHELMRLVRELAIEQGLAVLFTEHSMDVVFSYAHRVLVMAQGQVIAQGSPEEVQADEVVRQVYLGAPT